MSSSLSALAEGGSASPTSGAIAAHHSSPSAHSALSASFIGNASGIGGERSAADINNEQLRATVQRQADTVESLHSAAQKYKTRLTALEQQLTVKQAEIDSLKVLSTENAALREENFVANERIRELELATSRLTEQSTAGAESQAQLGVKLQAYQRHNHFLLGEIADREGKLKTAHERLDVLQEELRTKDRRVTILIEKLRQYNIDPTTTVSKVHVPEETFSQMKDKLATQSTTIELLREKVETMQEETTRREELVTTLRTENDTLKATISRLINQINGAALPARLMASDGAASTISGAATATSPSPNRNNDERLRKYHSKRLNDYVNTP